MTMRKKLIVNVVIIVSIMLIMAAISISGFTFIKSKLSYLLQTSTPFQVRTTDLQKALQASVSNLLQASISVNLEELSSHKGGFEKSVSEVKEAEDALVKLTGKQGGLYGEVRKLAEEIFQTAEKRLYSELETRKAGTVISEKLRDMVAKLGKLDAKMAAIQTHHSKALKEDFESSKMSAMKLRNVETLKASLEQLSSLIAILPNKKERKHVLVLKSKANGIMESFLENQATKASKEISFAANSIKQKITELFELHSTYIKQDDEETRQRLETLSLDIREDKIPYLLTTLNQIVDFLSIEAVNRNKRQDVSFAQAGIATNILSSNSALMTAGLSAESFIAKLFNASASKEIDSIAEEIRKTLDKSGSDQKVLELSLQKLEAREELTYLKDAVSALNTIRNLVFSADGVVARIHSQIEMKKRALDASVQLRKTVTKFTDEGRKDILSAHKTQEDSASAVNRVVGLSISASIIISCIALLTSIVASVVLLRTVVIPNELIEEISRFTNNLASMSNELSTNIDQQAAVVAQQSSAVIEISSTMEELSASSAQIAKHSEAVVIMATETWDDTKKGTITVESVIAKMGGIDTDNQNSSSEIVELGRKSKEITKVVNIINAIADQTKIIAFNAAIEASSAGETGKRFGVVAVEVRKLADSVMESSREIESNMSKIQEAINRLVIASEKSSKGIHEGLQSSQETVAMICSVVSAAKSTQEAALQISLSTQQQKIAGDQVVTALREITSGVGQTSDSIRQISSICKEMTQLSDTLKGQVERCKLT